MFGSAIDKPQPLEMSSKLLGPNSNLGFLLQVGRQTGRGPHGDKVTVCLRPSIDRLLEQPQISWRDRRGPARSGLVLQSGNSPSIPSSLPVRHRVQADAQNSCHILAAQTLCEHEKCGHSRPIPPRLASGPDTLKTPSLNCGDCDRNAYRHELFPPSFSPRGSLSCSQGTR
jgi:hypothetical protein